MSSQANIISFFVSIRHCVYDHENVDRERREKRIFNTAFWIDKEEDEDLEGWA